MSDPLIPVISEAQVAAALSPADAVRIVRDAFLAVEEKGARHLPVLRESLGAGRIFGIKSAVDDGRGLLGFKAGGAFPANLAFGAPAHQSSVVLLDAESGHIRAIVSGNRITALRTAAACALSIDLFARKDAKSLGLVGAGAQAEAHLRAALEARPFETVRIWSRAPERAADLAQRMGDAAAVAAVEDLEDLARTSDVLITLTPSTAPLVAAEWIRPGTHLACMGADTAGKQEVASALAPRAQLYTDDIEQAVTIGELQAPVREGLIGRDAILGTLGGVIAGRVEGRRADGDITLYDGTGVALQDLLAAAFVVEKHRASLERFRA